MAERLRKVKERKRLRKGLPIKSPDEDDDDKVIYLCILDYHCTRILVVLAHEGAYASL